MKRLVATLVLALGVQNVRDVVHEGLVVHSVRGSMNLSEHCMFRHCL